ncbi:MAG: YkgJ family cysteine cluster protein [Candidatus Methylomirabilales bacterium]
MDNGNKLVRQGESTSVKPDKEPANGYEALRQEIVGGLLYNHHRTNANTSKTLEVTSFAYALIELLVEKGLLTVEELDERKRQVAERLAEKFRDNGMGVIRQEPEYDKYTFDGGVKIDCENRIHLCHAACCRLQFALSRQDVEDGVVRWDFARPYLIQQGKDGYCVHLERKTCHCSIYEHRPVPCRAYDCRNDKRIWLDFEKKIVNPDLEKVFQRQTAEPTESQPRQEQSS